MSLMSAEDSVRHIQEVLQRRGIDIPPSTEDSPHNHAGQPGEPGDPSWHHAHRVELALSRWENITPPHYRQASADHPNALEWADHVAHESRTASSLMLWGGTGTGKTHEAFGAARRIAESGPSRFGLVFITHPEMYAELRPKSFGEEEREQLEKRLLNTPLLILDDLGTAKETEWTGEVLYRIVNYRYNQLLPTILTTNHAPKSLPEVVGDRIASRLIQMTTRLQLTGNDRRLTR